MKWGIIALILWTLFLVVLLLAPIRETPMPTLGFMHWDKVAHFSLFTITALVSVFNARFLTNFRSRMAFGAALGLSLAVFTELAQSLVPFRDTSLYDLLADVAGLCVGLIICTSVSRIPVVRAFLG